MQQSTLKEFPLLRYATQSWYKHYADGASYATENGLTMKLFDPTCRNNFICWLMMYDPDDSNRLPSELIFDQNYFVTTPLYYTSLLGLIDAIKSALQNQADVNAVGGRYGNAL